MMFWMNKKLYLIIIDSIYQSYLINIILSPMVKSFYLDLNIAFALVISLDLIINVCLSSSISIDSGLYFVLPIIAA